MAKWLLKNRQFSQDALDNAINQLAEGKDALSKEMITLLRSHGAHFSAYNNAALQNGVPLSKLQLAGGDVKEIAAATSESTLLELYKRKRKSEVVSLIKNGAPKDDAEKLLLEAIENRDIEFLKQILPYKQIPKYHYFLEMAVAWGDLKLFNVLLQNYNEKEVDFTRLLGTAIYSESLELTKLCVEKGGDVNGHFSGRLYFSYDGYDIQSKSYEVAIFGLALLVENDDIVDFLASKGVTE